MRRAPWTAVAAGLVAALGFPAGAGAKTVADRNWTFRLRRRNRLPRGKYEIRVRATDIAGTASDAPSAAAGTLVTFRIV